MERNKSCRNVKQMKYIASHRGGSVSSDRNWTYCVLFFMDKRVMMKVQQNLLHSHTVNL